jgi:succinoglycan biosynthesis transport protein ExoP
LVENIAQPTQAAQGRESIANLKEYAGAMKRGWRLIVACVAIFLTIAVIYLATTKRVYQATARLLVLQQGGRPLNMANTDPSRLMEGADDYIPTHSQIISSQLVVRRAIDMVGLGRLPSLAAAKAAGLNPVEVAIERLKVTRPDRFAKIVCVDYRDGSRDEATQLLDAITVSYRGFLADTFQKNSSQVISLIAKARDELSHELGGLEEKYVEFRENSPVLSVGETGRSFAAQRLEQTDLAMNQARDRALKIKLQLELGRNLVREGSELWAIAHALNQLDGDSASLTAFLNSTALQLGATDYIRQLTSEQHQLAERYGAQNAKAVELQQQITRAQERSRAMRDRLEQSDVNHLLNSIEKSLKSVESLEAELGKRFESELDQAKKIEIDLLEEANLRANLERQRSLFNTVVDQLKQAQFAGDFNSITCEVLEPANALRHPVSPPVSLILALALFSGGMAGTATVLLANWLDQRIRSSEELRAVLGLTALGQIPMAGAEEVGKLGQLGLVSQTNSRSQWAEAYRALRTNLEFLRRRRRIEVILVTSPYAGDGKSTTASNIAISFACTGRKVLLVDADLRKPSQHAIHGFSNHLGLTDHLVDGLPIERVVRHTTLESLDLVTVGPDVSNPAELLASGAFGAFVTEARRTYDLVIIDSSPMLAVTDPAIIGALVDGVVLVVRPSSLKRNDAVSVREHLNGLGTPILGAVINGVNRDTLGHGYGYGYGYGYGSGKDDGVSKRAESRSGSVSKAPSRPFGKRTEPAVVPEDAPGNGRAVPADHHDRPSRRFTADAPGVMGRAVPGDHHDRPSRRRTSDVLGGKG